VKCKFGVVAQFLTFNCLDVQQEDWNDLESLPKREEVAQVAATATPPQSKAKRLSKIKKFLFTRFSG
jgi:hypothetical protein